MGERTHKPLTIIQRIRIILFSQRNPPLTLKLQPQPSLSSLLFLYLAQAFLLYVLRTPVFIFCSPYHHCNFKNYFCNFQLNTCPILLDNTFLKPCPPFLLLKTMSAFLIVNSPVLSTMSSTRLLYSYMLKARKWRVLPGRSGEMYTEEKLDFEGYTGVQQRNACLNT